MNLKKQGSLLLGASIALLFGSLALESGKGIAGGVVIALLAWWLLNRGKPRGKLLGADIGTKGGDDSCFVYGYYDDKGRLIITDAKTLRKISGKVKVRISK